MSELSPEPSIPAAGADPGRRKAVAHEARGAQTCAVTSAVGLGKINAPLAVTANPVPRLYNLPDEFVIGRASPCRAVHRARCRRQFARRF